MTVHYRKKDMIRVGQYILADGSRLEVTPERIDRWVTAFGRMRGAGVDVEFSRDHSTSSRDQLGRVVAMYRTGNRLIGVHEVWGNDALAECERVGNVSVEIDQDFVDGTGRRYGDTIVASSLVQRPVVAGQERFEPYEPEVERILVKSYRENGVRLMARIRMQAGNDGGQTVQVDVVELMEAMQVEELGDDIIAAVTEKFREARALNRELRGELEEMRAENQRLREENIALRNGEPPTRKREGETMAASRTRRPEPWEVEAQRQAAIANGVGASVL